MKQFQLVHFNRLGGELARLDVASDDQGPLILATVAQDPNVRGTLELLEPGDRLELVEIDPEPEDRLELEPAPEPEPSLEELQRRRDNLLAWRIQTNGHGKRARIQEEIDELEAKIAELDPFAPGAVWSSKWGYEQTNCDFYRVVKRAGAWLTLEPIASIEQSDDTEERPATMTGKVVPADPVQAIGKTFRRKIAQYTSGPFVKIRSYSYAHPWDGHPERVSHYG